MKLTGKSRRRGGSVIVEFALVLPMLLILSMMIIQYGILLNATLTISNLARQGARFAAVHPESNDDITDYIKDNLPVGFKAADITSIEISPAVAASRVTDSAVSVTVTYNMNKRIFMPKKFFGVNFMPSNFSSKAVMRVE